MLDIIGHKNIFLIASGALLTASLIAIGLFGFRQGIDFQGGTLWQFRIPEERPSLSELEATFKSGLGTRDAIVSYDSANGVFLVRLPVIEEIVHQENLAALRDAYPAVEELSFQSIGPSVGRELRRKSLTAVLFVLLAISLYIAFAFRKVSRPISSWKYGVITLVTLFHDVLIPAGLLAVLGRLAGVEIDSNFVVALLVVAGFSVHDTIVVFDRIRENLALHRGRADFASIINESINQTLGRSVNTSLTLILVLIALYVAGPPALGYFVLTLLVGVSVGTYSSIFVASPALLLASPKKIVHT